MSGTPPHVTCILHTRADKALLYFKHVFTCFYQVSILKCRQNLLTLPTSCLQVNVGGCRHISSLETLHRHMCCLIFLVMLVNLPVTTSRHSSSDCQKDKLTKAGSHTMSQQPVCCLLFHVSITLETCT